MSDARPEKESAAGSARRVSGVSRTQVREAMRAHLSRVITEFTQAWR
ncbi:hypothetical protein [Burkholderia catarinensis]|nr:hypothetical protein [Burkholderia catarinensis]